MESSKTKAIRKGRTIRRFGKKTENLEFSKSKKIVKFGPRAALICPRRPYGREMALIQPMTHT
jgi:hypothetical protein